MAETLGQKQRRFTRLIGLLIEFAYQNGYELSFGESKRSDEQSHINALGPYGRKELVDYLMKSGNAKFKNLADMIANNTGSGIKNSLHELQLAVDFNLFRDGVYLSRTEDHRQLGEYWESLGEDCRWGGRFNDGNHYSLEYNGRK